MKKFLKGYIFYLLIVFTAYGLSHIGFNFEETLKYMALYMLCDIFINGG